MVDVVVLVVVVRINAAWACAPLLEEEDQEGEREGGGWAGRRAAPPRTIDGCELAGGVLRWSPRYDSSSSVKCSSIGKLLRKTY